MRQKQTDIKVDGAKILSDESIFRHLNARQKIIGYLLTVFVFFLWYRSYMNLTFEGSLIGEVSIDILLMSLGFCYLPIFGLFFFNTLFVFYVTPGIVKRFHSGHFIKILLDFLFSWVSVLAVNGTFIAVSWMLSKNAGVEWLQTIVVNMLIFLMHEAFYFLNNYRKTSLKLERERRMTAQLEYNILRSQVSPHFLFNSLNILYSLSYIDAEKSREFTLSLSQMYRYIVAHHHSKTVTVDDEMEFLQSYVDVLKTMYNDSLNVNIIIRGKYNRNIIVPYSLQLMMENVIKHNVIDEDRPMNVEITVDQDGISMVNDIIPKIQKRTTGGNTGIGLKYLNELYSSNGGTCKVERDEKRFKITIPYLKNP